MLDLSRNIIGATLPTIRLTGAAFFWYEVVHYTDGNERIIVINQTLGIWVCGPNDTVPEGTAKLCVGSWAPVANPNKWKCLWRLSPLSTVEGGVAVPGLAGVKSVTVENAWQFLKIWPDEPGWREDDAREAFQSTCAMRYPRGKGARAVAHHWGLDGSRLSYIEARKRIYVPCYLEMLLKPDRAELIGRLHDLASSRAVYIWDPDSYDLRRFGMSDIVQTVACAQRPFAHAFLAALAVQGRVDLLWDGGNAQTMAVQSCHERQQ